MLGAGVSHPYGYPLGIRLVDLILKRLAEEADPLSIEIRNLLEDSGLYSIDAFLQRRPKYAPTVHNIIKEIILACENPKKPVAPIDDFYRYLSNQMCDQLFDEVGLVTFNYDRSAQYRLAKAIAAQDGVDLKTAFERLSLLQITHVHGRLPYLPGEKPQQPTLEYGIHKNRNPQIQTLDLNDLSSEESGLTASDIAVLESSPLKTVLSDEEPHQTAAAMIAAASRVFFLGFSYQELNMKMIGCDSTWARAKKSFGTCIGLPGYRHRQLNGSIRFADCKPVELFQNHFPLLDP